ncbi:MAG: acetylglutamate kinase [Chloroflexota bacterium]
MPNVIVVKIGGAVFTTEDSILQDFVTLQKEGKALVVVHGGGNIVTEWLQRQRIATRFVHGERVTDKETLDVVVSLLGGLANKGMVAAICNMGGRAIGISGVDGAMVQGKKRSEELGLVGEVLRVDTHLLDVLLAAGYIVLVSPLSLHASGRADIEPHILNINGDPLAGEIAAAVGAERLVFLTDVPGLLDGAGELRARLSAAEAEELVDSGAASGGMVPKIKACIRALSGTAVTRIIDGRKPHALLAEMAGEGGGTTIYR